MQISDKELFFDVVDFLSSTIIDIGLADDPPKELKDIQEKAQNLLEKFDKEGFLELTDL